jgi:NADH:ubiquinone oxidoreductase subunit 6 (subunit J)
MNETLVRALAVASMAFLFIGAIMMVEWPKWVDDGDSSDDFANNEEVAFKLFGTDADQGYGLVVFLTGVLLLVAMLGGVFLAKEEEKQ